MSSMARGWRFFGNWAGKLKARLRFFTHQRIRLAFGGTFATGSGSSISRGAEAIGWSRLGGHKPQKDQDQFHPRLLLFLCLPLLRVTFTVTVAVTANGLRQLSSATLSAFARCVSGDKGEPFGKSGQMTQERYVSCRTFDARRQ